MKFNARVIVIIFTSIWDMWYWKVWFDLIWFDLINKTFQISLKTTFIMDLVHFSSLPIYKQQVLSISFPFSRFRCSCSRNCHSRNAEMVGLKLEKTAFLSLAERRRKSSSAVVEIVVCFVLLNFRYLFDWNEFQTFSQSNRKGVSSSLTNANNYTFLHSFSNFTNCCE